MTDLTITALNVTKLSFGEMCRETGIPSEIVVEIIEHGIVEPAGASQDEWRFTTEMITITCKAVRLQRELELEWAGIALALELMEKIDALRQQNLSLRRRLGRFAPGENTK